MGCYESLSHRIIILLSSLLLYNCMRFNYGHHHNKVLVQKFDFLFQILMSVLRILLCVIRSATTHLEALSVSVNLVMYS